MGSQGELKSYGGQALLEGVLMRGQWAAAWAVRRPDGSLYIHTEPLRGLYRHRWMRLPFLRGLLSLADALWLGMRAMVDAANQQATDPKERLEGPGLYISLGLSFLVALVVFLWFPMALGFGLVEWGQGPVWLANTLEGAFRLLLLIGYLLLLGRAQEVQRLFGYHAAEHQTIHAYEHGADLTPEEIARFPAAHPRCGTAFLLMVVLVAVVLFSLWDPGTWWGRLILRIGALPLLVALSYEALRWTWKHHTKPWARWLIAPHLALQRLTTRPPQRDMIEVALTAFWALLDAEKHFGANARPTEAGEQVARTASSPLVGVPFSSNIETRLVLIRHGETDWNVEGRYQGQADPPLNERGRIQAHRLIDELRPLGIQVLYSSPLRRAWETAVILAQGLKVPLYLEPRLKEIHQGEWQGMLVEDIRRRYPDLFQRWEQTPWDVRVPGGETLEEVQQRVYEAIDEIVKRHQGQTIGIVTHRLPMALLKVRYQGLDPQQVRQIPIGNTAWEVISLGDEGD